MTGNIDKQLSKMSLEELVALRSQTDKMIKDHQVAQKKDLKNKFKEMAAGLGLSLEDVVGAGAPLKTGKKRNYPAKFRNPENPEQTWTGLGIKPLWVRAYLEQGKSLDDLRIPG